MSDAPTATAKRQAGKATVCEHLSIADLCSECIAKAVRRAGLNDATPSKYSPAARELAAYEADIYKAKRNARVAKKGGLR